MGLPAWVIPGIGAAANIAGNLINAGSQRRENTRQRQFAMDMYNRQRNDALADWNMQNAYNDPSAMMARLKHAGLNPNLAYGNPTTAGVASSVRSSSQGSYNGKAPTVETTGISDAIMMFYDIQKTQAQTDNIKAQAELARIKTESESQQIDKLVQETIGIEKLNKQRDLDYYIKDTQEKHGYYDANTSRAINEADRSQYEAKRSRIAAFIADESKYLTLEQMAANLARTEQSTKESRQRIENAIKDGKIKDFEIKLNDLNMTKGDPLWVRAVARLFQELLNF